MTGRQPHDLVFGQYEVSQSLRYFRPHPVSNHLTTDSIPGLTPDTTPVTPRHKRESGGMLRAFSEGQPD